ncbi:MAG: hypothetical protein AAGU11_12935, partial [Syntrophobacteraceae bacterium]
CRPHRLICQQRDGHLQHAPNFTIQCRAKTLMALTGTRGSQLPIPRETISYTRFVTRLGYEPGQGDHR